MDGANTTDFPEPLHARLLGLCSLLCNHKNALDDCNYGKIVDLAHEISTFHRSPADWQYYGSEKNAGTLQRQISFLGRLRRGFNTFSAASERLPCFSQVCIIACERPRGSLQHSKSPRRKAPYSLASALASIGLISHDGTAMGAIAKQNRETLAKAFEKLQTESWQVHAEVQVAMRMAEYQGQDAQHGNYIGCSRLSCLLCSHFLRSYGGISTRGCHGKIYELWNIPESCAMTQEEASKIAHAVQYLEQMVKGLLQTSNNRKRNQCKESTVGDSIISNAARHFDSLSLALRAAEEIERLHDVQSALAAPYEGDGGSQRYAILTINRKAKQNKP